MKTFFFTVLTIVVISTSAVIADVDPEGFFLQYGYLKEKKGNRAERPTPEELQKAILNFQRFNGLPQTGIMDKTTKKKMIAPRCGVKDVENGEMAEYNSVSKWPKNLITWKINKYSSTSRLSPAEQKRAIKRGLQRWANDSPLVFRETGGKATLDISFEKQRHGDGYAFDGKGQVLAHAFFPQNGDTHFDDDEIWINGKSGGSDLETVAAHEFGHALGLGHSSESKSLMAPYYQVFPDGFTLHADDIAGIQKLYGKNTDRTTTRKNTRRTTTRPTTRTDRKETTPKTFPPPTGNGFCNHAYRRIDAAMRISGNDFVFVDNNNVIDGRTGHKTTIRRIFPGGPNLVHAAVYSNRARKAYLFKDRRVWAYKVDSNGRFDLVRNFPKTLTNSYIHKPEAAMRFNYYGSERIFLIKNGYFNEFVPYYESVSPGRGYPTRQFFTNIRSRIDASISTDSEVSFIVNKKAYRMQNRNRSVDIRGKPVNLVFNKCQN